MMFDAQYGGLLPLFLGEELAQRERPGIIWGNGQVQSAQPSPQAMLPAQGMPGGAWGTTGGTWGNIGGNTQTAKSGGLFSAQASPFAAGNQHAQDMASGWELIKQNPSTLALLAGLSMLANNNGRRSFGQLLGRAGVDALGGLGNMRMQTLAEQRQKTLDEQNAAQQAFNQQLARDRFGLDSRQADFDMATKQAQLELSYRQLGLNAWQAQRAAAKELRQEQLRANMLQKLGMGGTAPQASGTGATIGERNNNLLNLKNPGNTSFRTFNSVDESWPAYVQQLQRYQARGLTTPAQMIATWAPAADGNNTAKYIANVGQWTGLDMHKPLDLNDPEQTAKLLSGMAQAETSVKVDPAYIAAVLRGQTPAQGQALPAPDPAAAQLPLQDPVQPQAQPAPTMPQNMQQGTQGMDYPYPQITDADLTAMTLSGDPTLQSLAKLVYDRRDKYSQQAERQQKAALQQAEKELKVQEKQDKIADAQAKKEERERMQVAAKEKMGIQVENMNRLMALASKPGNLGLWNSFASKFPGTEPRDVNALIDSVGSAQVLNSLAALKAASANGASGMGALSDKEGAYLKEQLGSLDNWQSKEQFLRGIQNMLNVVQAQMYAYGYTPDEIAQIMQRGKGTAQQERAAYQAAQAPASTQNARGAQIRLRYNPQTRRLE